MAATLVLQYAAATGDQVFIQRTMMAMLATCVNVTNEVAGTTNHANRMLLMKAATNSPQVYAPLFAFAVAAQGIDGNSTDVALQAMCSTVFNTLAGMP